MRIENEVVMGEQGKQPVNIQERAFEFSCRVVKLYQFLNKQSGAGRILGNQVLRAGTSIGANLEEADAGQSRADFISKCSIALKEARETHYWLRLLVACQIVPKEKMAELIEEANELVAILTTIVKKSKENR